MAPGPRQPTPATAGYSGTPLPAKLGVKEGSIVALIDAPAGFESLLEPLPAGARARRSGRGASEVMVVFVRTFDQLASAVARFTPRTDIHYLWLAWPKKTSRLAGPLGENDLRDAGLAAGWVDTKVCAIDADWSGLRFTRRKS
jgi:hypothetical protein